jgi:hypothetical protein
MEYEPKTSGIRRVKHAIGACTRRKNRMESAGKVADQQVLINYQAAIDATNEFDELHKQKVLLEDAGNRLWNHLSLLPSHMFTNEMKFDLDRWNDVLMNNEKNRLKLPSLPYKAK